MTDYLIAMRFLLLLVVLFSQIFTSQAKDIPQCIVSSTSLSVEALHPLLRDQYARSIYLSLFTDWIHHHQMNFETNEVFVKRLQIFVDNDQFIRFVNRRNLSYQLGHNAFSHLTFEEWRESIHFGWVFQLDRFILT